MSELQPTPHTHSHPPIRKARPTRRSASGPGDRVASARDIAIYFREDCRTLSDSLQLEMVVAQYILQIRDVRATSGVAVGGAVAAGVIAELEGHGDALSHAILRGLAHLGSEETARRSSEGAARLAERVVGLPREFADVARTTPLGAWCVREDQTGDRALLAEFEHPRGRRHSIALWIDSRGDVVKHIGLLNPLSELASDPEQPFHPSSMETLEIAAAGALVREVLERSYGPDCARTDDFRVLIALARAAAMSRADDG